MSENQIISSNDLIEKIEGDISNNKLKFAGQFLLASINDWPTINVSEPIEFLKELKKHINTGLTYENIEIYYKTLNMSNHAWEMESLHQLLRVFDCDKTKDLESIIIDISNYYKS